MDCTKCDRDAVMHAAYSGTYLCESHFVESVERRVRKRIRADNLLPSDATPEDPETWVVGLSGGKDSVVLTTLLQETFERDPRVELVCLTIHEGIEGYRDESLEACLELADDLGLRHEIATYADEFDLQMDDVVEDDPMDMAACAYCGVFRRDLLAKYAEEYDADKLLTGHNLDDEAETALMNVFEGNVEQMAKHFDASLGPFPDSSSPRDTDSASQRERDSERDSPPTRQRKDGMIPRAKPLRDIPEKEVALYAQLREIPVHMAECPHSSEAFRGEIQSLLLDLEENHPGTRHSIMAGYEEFAQLAAERYRGDEPEGVSECVECGAPTTRERCRKCALVDAVRAV